MPLCKGFLSPLSNLTVMCNCRYCTQAGLEQDCWRVLNRCIQHVEVASERDKAVNAAVQRTMDTLLQQVTLRHVLVLFLVMISGAIMRGMMG